MRPRTMVITAAAVGVLALTASATVAAPGAGGPPDDLATHHEIDGPDMVAMHDAMTDAHAAMDTHMGERLRDRGIAPSDLHGGASMTGYAHSSGWGHH